MTTTVAAGTATQELMSYGDGGEGYALPYAAIRETQIRAMNERLEDQIDRIKLVKMRAEEAGVTQVRELADAVSLLLPHTSYKTYPESFVMNGRWDRLTKWLGTVSARPTDNVDLSGVENIDQWVERCAQAGHMVSCSSGTTGKSAMLVATQQDLEFSARDGVAAVEWGSAMRRGDNRTMIGSAGTIAYTPRNVAIGQALMAAFVDPGKPKPTNKVPPITIGSIIEMIVLRKKVADGTAMPQEIAHYEAQVSQREAILAEARVIAIDEAIERRGDRLYTTGMWASVYALAEGVRSRGYDGKDFHPENGIYLGGGLKRAQLPDNYREFVYQTFNMVPKYIYQMYGMQEIHSSMPRCREGQRYHVPPWVVALPLNKDGDALVEFRDVDGEVECRAAFFDLSLEGRWGGVISGDKIKIDFRPCACGAGSPSIRDDIVRYSDIEGDDKIACSGTVDAYVRGLS